MLVNCFVLALCWATGISLATANIAPLNNNIRQTRDAAASSPNSLRALRRAISSTAMSKRDDTVNKNSTSLDRSWNDAVLFTL
jgi:hypothetical protein